MFAVNRIKGAGAVLAAMLLCFGPTAYLLGVSGAPVGDGGADALPLASAAYRLLLGNSLFVSAGTTGLALLAAVPLAFMLVRMRLPMKRLFGAIVIGCAVLPLHIYVAAWVGALGIQTIPGTLFRLTNTGTFMPLWNAVLIGGLAKVPLATLLVGLSLWGMRPETEEAAWLDTSRLGVLRHVVLRHVGGGLMFAGSILFGLSLGEIAVTDILSIRTLAEEAYILFQLTLNPQAVVVAGSLIFLPILIPWITLLCLKTTGQSATDEAVNNSESAVFRQVSVPVRGIAIAFIICAMLGICGIPMMTFIRLLLRHGGIIQGVANLADEYVFSLVVSGAAALLSTAMAFPLVFGCNGSRWGAGLTGIALGGLFVPGAVTGIALVKIFNQPGIMGLIYSSPVILVIGQFLRYFPLSLLLLWVFLRAVPKQYEQMAIVDGASAKDVLLRVYLPICIKPVIISAIVVFLWCLGDLDASLIICPPGTTTLSIRMFTMLHFGVYGDVAMACLMLVSTIMAGLVPVVCLAGRESTAGGLPR